MAKKIAVIGLGDFGKQLLTALVHDGHEVAALDRDQETIQSISDIVATAVCLDTTDERAMRAQGLDDMDLVILASAERFETLIVTADVLRKIGVSEIVARYRNDLQKRILTMLGVTNIFNPEMSAARSMADSFHREGIKTSFLLSDQYRVAEVLLPRTYIGVSIKESRLREDYELNLVTVKRPKKKNPMSKPESEEILGIPRGETTFREGDILVLFGAHENIDKFLDHNI
jgi:trk system potassium uptake protein